MKPRFAILTCAWLVATAGVIAAAAPAHATNAAPKPAANSTASQQTSGDLPPTVRLTSPAPTQIWGEPGVLPLAATASDPDGSIASVRFFTAASASGPFTLVATVTTAPYTFQLLVPNATVFAIRATAYDDAGLTATDTETIRVAVSDLGVKLTSPNSTAVYPEPGTIQLTAVVSLPPALISKVEFYTAQSTGGPFTLAAILTTAPYSVPLTVSVPGSVLAVQARAYGVSGQLAIDTVGIHVAVVHPSPSPAAR